MLYPKTSRKSHRGKGIEKKKKKAKENVKFVNSVIRGSARQAWNSDYKHLWKIVKNE